ncbi:MAG: hypothetical protein H6850_01215 [Alphaproteobacteria bacterium]|nr:MAG: hypothetical protein H6850_01215 [Alphaproteobacteria bacterium]
MSNSCTGQIIMSIAISWCLPLLVWLLTMGISAPTYSKPTLYASTDSIPHAAPFENNPYTSYEAISIARSFIPYLRDHTQIDNDKLLDKTAEGLTNQWFNAVSRDDVSKINTILSGLNKWLMTSDQTRYNFDRFSTFLSDYLSLIAENLPHWAEYQGDYRGEAYDKIIKNQAYISPRIFIEREESLSLLKLPEDFVKIAADFESIDGITLIANECYRAASLNPEYMTSTIELMQSPRIQAILDSAQQSEKPRWRRDLSRLICKAINQTKVGNKDHKLEFNGEHPVEKNLSKILNAITTNPLFKDNIPYNVDLEGVLFLDPDEVDDIFAKSADLNTLLAEYVGDPEMILWKKKEFFNALVFNKYPYNTQQERSEVREKFVRTIQKIEPVINPDKEIKYLEDEYFYTKLLSEKVDLDSVIELFSALKEVLFPNWNDARWTKNALDYIITGKTKALEFDTEAMKDIALELKKEFSSVNDENKEKVLSSLMSKIYSRYVWQTED